MNQFVFKSRWIAIAFAVLTLFSAYVFIGGWHDGSETGGVEQPLPADTQGAPSAVEPAPVVEQPMDDTEFVDDEELIDDASGDDPVPDVSDGDSADGNEDVDTSDSDDSGFADGNTDPGAG